MSKEPKEGTTATENELDEIAQAAAATPAELALALLVLARALRPRTKTARTEFDRRIRKALARCKGEQALLRFLLTDMLR